MLHEHVEFLEGIMVEEEVEAFARRQLAALVLRVDSPLTAAHAGAFATFFQDFEDMFHGGIIRNKRIFPRGFSTAF
jgi:hypothetical protein